MSENYILIQLDYFRGGSNSTATHEVVFQGPRKLLKECIGEFAQFRALLPQPSVKEFRHQLVRFLAFRQRRVIPESMR